MFSYLGPVAFGDYGDTFGSTSLPDKIAKHKAQPVEKAVLSFFNKFVGSDQPVRSMDEASQRANHILGQIREAEIGIIDQGKAIKREILLHQIVKENAFKRKDEVAPEKYQEIIDSIDKDIEALESKKQPFLDQIDEIATMVDLVGDALSYYRTGGYAALVDEPNLAGLTGAPLPKQSFKPGSPPDQ
ncbi:hypothetical protein [Dongia sp.]|uniref:hypothetical protein n=1 Tax=Dongia sp. TaxID=1977262 RepID=UPI0037527CBA